MNIKCKCGHNARIHIVSGRETGYYVKCDWCGRQTAKYKFMSIAVLSWIFDKVII